MKSAYAMYVLGIEWFWDHRYRQYSITTIGRRGVYRSRSNFGRILDTDLPENRRENMLSYLKLVVYGGGAIYGKRKMTRLWGVVYGPVKMELKLVPICDFNEDDNPIPVRAAVAA